MKWAYVMCVGGARFNDIEEVDSAHLRAKEEVAISYTLGWPVLTKNR